MNGKTSSRVILALCRDLRFYRVDKFPFSMKHETEKRGGLRRLRFHRIKRFARIDAISYRVPDR